MPARQTQATYYTLPASVPPPHPLPTRATPLNGCQGGGCVGFWQVCVFAMVWVFGIPGRLWRWSWGAVGLRTMWQFFDGGVCDGQVAKCGGRSSSCGEGPVVSVRGEGYGRPERGPLTRRVSPPTAGREDREHGLRGAPPHDLRRLLTVISTGGLISP